MFDIQSLERLTSREILAAVEQNHRILMAAENTELVLASAWADDQERDPADPFAPLIHRSTVDGSEGRPQIDEGAVLEFGAVLGVGFVTARNLISDAVQIRQRLPRLWERVKLGNVRGWQARKIVEATRPLDDDAAADVDDQLSGLVTALPWGRFSRLLPGAVLTADPDGVRAREERARTERMVRCCDSDHGLKLLIARATSGDAIWFMATINRLAEILAEDGDSDTVEVRRSKAIGILAQPARALQLLATHVRTSTEPEAGRRDWPSDSGSAPAGRSGTGEVSTTESEESSGDDDDHHSLEVPGWAADIDPKALRPRVVLYFHLAEATLSDASGLVRPEVGGPTSLNALVEFLAGAGCQVKVSPVITPADEEPVDGYEIPYRIREAVRLRHLADVFPFGSGTGRGMDLDHTTPFDPQGDRGQTGLHNLGPLSRTAHRAATGGRFTRGRWRKRQPSPGTFVWRSPHGWIYLVTNHGTLGLGQSEFARRAWDQACRRPADSGPHTAGPPSQSSRLRASALRETATPAA